jgi:hypothetical protein
VSKKKAIDPKGELVQQAVDEEGNVLMKERMPIIVPASIHAEIKVMGAMYQLEMNEIVIKLWRGFAVELEKQLMTERKLGKPRRMENGFIVD